MARKKKQVNGPGRVAGVPNLQKTSTGYKNQHGVSFTAQEKKALEAAVNTATRKRKRLLEAAAEKPRMVGGKDTGQKMAEVMKLGYESDFILAKKSKSLQQFESKQEYEIYMQNLRRVNQRDYVQKRVDLYKENHAAAIARELNDSETAAKLAMLDRNDYLELSMEYEDVMEIHYVYGPDQRDDKLAAINSALDSFIESKGNKYKSQKREGFKSLLQTQYEATGDARETLRQRAARKKKKR